MRWRPKNCPFRSNPYPNAAILIIALIYLVTNFSHHRWTRTDGDARGVIQWDVISYYSYLPATFIYGDVTLEFLDHPPPGFVNDNKFWPSTLENGNRLIITSMGLAVLYSPFFFAAHALAPLFGEVRDGFGSIYQFFLVFSAFFYVIFGLIILKKILSRFVKPRSVAITLIAVALGTNLYYYTTYEAAMPHSYNFFLITLFLWLVIRWYKKPAWYNSLLVGGLLGFISLVRPTNILVFFILFLWDVKSRQEFISRIRFFLMKFPLVLVMITGFFLVWIPQFLYWKEVTGHYLYFTYAEEGASFYWLHPHVWQSLFGFKKGWFIYTPIMFLAVISILLLRKRLPALFLPMLFILPVMVYVQSAWWSWWFGGGFGLRAYIDIYGLLAVPLAVLVDWILGQSRRYIRIPALSLLGLLLVFQFINTYQYRKNIIHYVGMNRHTYLRAFLRFNYPDDHWTTLTMPDYQLARKGIYVFYLTGSQYEYLLEMDRKDALSEVKEMIDEDRRLKKEIGWYAGRTGISKEKAMNEVAERMYLSMTKQ